jgi:hypothetical protein
MTNARRASAVPPILAKIMTMRLPAPAVPPVLPAMSPRRAYAETVALFMLVFGPAVLNAARVVFGAAWFGWWDHWKLAADMVAFAVAGVWLVWLAWGTRWLARLLAAVPMLLTVRFLLVERPSHLPGVTPVCVYYGSWAALTVALVDLLARHRGLGRRELGLGREPRSAGGWRAAYARGEDITTVSAVGMVISGGVLPMAMMAAGAHRPPNPVTLIGHDVLPAIAASINAGICEEFVMVAALVTALEAARRPTWQIYAVGLVMRLSIHLWWGPTVICVAVMAAIQIWLFRRYRRLLPLIIAHAYCDLNGFAHALYGWAGQAIIAPAIIASLLITPRNPRNVSSPVPSPDETKLAKTSS